MENEGKTVWHVEQREELCRVLFEKVFEFEPRDACLIKYLSSLNVEWGSED